MSALRYALAIAPAFAALAFAASAQPLYSWGLPDQMPLLPPAALPSEPGSPYVIYPIRGGMHMITGPGGNVTVQLGPDGVLVVDTGAAEAGAGLLAQIRRLSALPVRYVMNTSADPDHIGGNPAISAAGAVLEGGNTRPDVVQGSGGAPIWAHEGSLTRLATAGGEPIGWPSDSYFVAQKDLHFNDEAISLMHMPAADTAGDSVVVFRRRDVIAAGDVYTPDRYPQIDIENGGSIQGYLDALNHLLRLTIPEFNQQGGTLVVPGHGRLSDEADVAEYRDMVTFIRDRVQDMIRRRMTLAQIKAARPTFDYDPNFGVEAGDVFVDQIYRSLTAAQTAQGR